MRVINVIKIWNNTIDSIDSFGVFEEQLSQDVVDEAEKKFLELVKAEKDPDADIDDDEVAESLIDDGYSNMSTGVDITIVWTDI